VVAAVQTAMLADLPYPALRHAVLTHPTMTEAGSPYSRASSHTLPLLPKPRRGQKRVSSAPTPRRGRGDGPTRETVRRGRGPTAAHDAHGVGASPSPTPGTGRRSPIACAQWPPRPRRAAHWLRGSPAAPAMTAWSSGRARRRPFRSIVRRRARASSVATVIRSATPTPSPASAPYERSERIEAHPRRSRRRVGHGPPTLTGVCRARTPATPRRRATTTRTGAARRPHSRHHRRRGDPRRAGSDRSRAPRSR
jgi:hypothetical protein